MTDEQPPLVERVGRLDADLTAAERLAVAYLAAVDGGRTRQAIADAVGLSNGHFLNGLVDLEILDRRERQTDRGRNPYVYELTAETRSTLDVETPEWDYETLDRRVLRELATVHYERDISAAKASQLAREIPGASSTFVANRLGELTGDDGPVECVKRTSPASYRLVGAGLYTPYRALADAEAATDGGTDR